MVPQGTTAIILAILTKGANFVCKRASELGESLRRERNLGVQTLAARLITAPEKMMFCTGVRPKYFSESRRTRPAGNQDWFSWRTFRRRKVDLALRRIGSLFILSVNGI
jgi:hypothetical protein